MLSKLLETDVFIDMMRVHIYECLDYLLNNSVNFSIWSNLEFVKFEPELPRSISEQFKPITAFVLAGYTFESAVLNEDTLEFEAGFGADNVGAIVRLPLSAIVQVVVEGSPILINLTRPQEEVIQEDKSQREYGIKKSMSVLMSNPENKDLFK